MEKPEADVETTATVEVKAPVEAKTVTAEKKEWQIKPFVARTWPQTMARLGLFGVGISSLLQVLVLDSVAVLPVVRGLHLLFLVLCAQIVLSVWLFRWTQAVGCLTLVSGCVP